MSETNPTLEEAKNKSTENEEQNKRSNDKELSAFGLYKQEDLVSYLSAMIYGMVENARAMAFDAPGVIDNFEPGQYTRAMEGIRRMFDQNTGDGTIVALGFLGAETLLLSIEKVAKKLGKKGFDPEIRFLSSLAFGVGLATYLETTTIMNNTIDIPGDLFGVGLGAAAILTGKLMQKHITGEKIDQALRNTYRFISDMPDKFDNLVNMVAKALGREDVYINKKTISDSIAQEFSTVVEGIDDISEENNINQVFNQ
jgi:hypothetical protein